MKPEDLLKLTTFVLIAQIGILTFMTMRLYNIGSDINEKAETIQYALKKMGLAP